MNRRSFLTKVSLLASLAACLPKLSPAKDKRYVLNPEWVKARYRIEFIQQGERVELFYMYNPRFNTVDADGYPKYIKPFIEV